MLQFLKHIFHTLPLCRGSRRGSYSLLLSFLVLCPVSAQTTFADANALYAEGEYAQAAEAYRALIAEYPAESNREALALLQYNLGNACFKQGELAQSILAYERALRLKPNYKDAKYNLEFAQSKIIDNISDTQAFFLSNWAKAFRNLLAENTWLWLSIGLFVLFLAGAMVFLLGHETWLRKTAFYIGWIALLFSIWSGANATSLHRRDASRAEAVITQGIVNAKSSPDRSGTDLFTVHEGTKVEIRETLGTWCNIRVGNNEGWMPLNNLERI